MRGPFCLVIARTGGGHFKLYLEGYADSESPASRGLKLRYASVAGQPREGFRSLKAAHGFFLDLLSEARRRDYDREEVAARLKPGSRIPERRVLRSSHLLRGLRRRAPGRAPDGRAHPR